MNNPVISKSKPLKNAQATDSSYRSVGSARGGEDSSQFKQAKNSRKKSTDQAKNIAKKPPGAENDHIVFSSDSTYARAADTNNRNLGSVRGGNELSKFTEITSSEKNRIPQLRI